MTSTSKKKSLSGLIVTSLAAAPFLLSAVLKFSGASFVVKGFAHLGWPQSMLLPLGLLESLCVLLYLVPLTSVFGAILLTGYIGGTIATHLRIGEPIITQSLMGILVWLGLFLRDARFRELLPLRGSDFRVEREVTIERPKAEIFTYLKSLDNSRNWDPFLRKDTNATIKTRGTDGHVGYVKAWEGNRELGAGEQEITRIVEGERIDFELRFKKPFSATHCGYFSLEACGESSTRVRWGMTGRSVFPMNVIGTLIDCDRMIGNEFEWGLNQLKSILEKE